MQEKGRADWLDLLRGILAFLVILSHVPNTPGIKHTIDSFFLIPGFFIVSGYLCSIDYHNVFSFIYYRILKMVVLYLTWCILLQFSFLSNLKNIIDNPTTAWNYLRYGIEGFLQGGPLWFVPCLILTMLYFVILLKLSKNHNWKLIIGSLLFSALGFIVTEEGITRVWGFDLALVLLPFYSMGYLLKTERVFENKLFIKWQSFITTFAIVIYGVFLLIATRLTSQVSINTRMSAWHNLFITIPGFLLGNLAIVLLCYKVRRVWLLNYAGKHSLVYFALGSRYNSQIQEALIRYTGGGISNYVINPLTCLLSGILVIVPCILIDRYIPALNGGFRMPAITETFYHDNKMGLFRCFGGILLIILSELMKADAILCKMLFAVGITLLLKTKIKNHWKNIQ